ncbi:hypothetical protein V8B97DRAFT_1965357 [Scleroderma yunnanense]
MASRAANILTTIPAIPAVVTRVHDAQKLVAALRRTLNSLPRAQSYLSFLKLCAFLVMLSNAGSLPFVWHLRVFWPIIVTRIRFLLLRPVLLFKSPEKRKQILAERVEALCPIGANPFEVTVYRRWASIDDADMFGIHLSNSSYAKALDSARLRILWKAFPAWAVSGGFIALGATHYHFIREIPLFARYEVRISIASWDNKWMYVIARYITRPKGSRAMKAVITSNGDVTLPSHSPTDMDTNTDSSSQSNGTPTLNGVANNADNLEKTLADALAATRTPTRRPTLEPDGSLLHCIAISQVCFKQDRISVPPAVALASEGFSKHPPCALESTSESELNGSHKAPARYTPSNPPPHWAKVRDIRVPPTGSMKHFKEFLKGGWKEVPSSNGHAEGADASKTAVGERWWEEALSGPIEEQRKKNLEIVEALRVGMERIRGTYLSLEGCETLTS